MKPVCMKARKEEEETRDRKDNNSNKKQGKTITVIRSNNCGDADGDKKWRRSVTQHGD